MDPFGSWVTRGSTSMVYVSSSTS
jgi:hypothetical protein